MKGKQYEKDDIEKTFRRFKKSDQGRVALVRWDDTGREDMMILEVDDDGREAKAFHFSGRYMQRVTHTQVCEIGGFVKVG